MVDFPANYEVCSRQEKYDRMKEPTVKNVRH